MKIILTKHSKQRRPHYDITPDDFLIKWVNFFEKKFNIENAIDGMYKISSGGNTAIIRKESHKIILITFRGFKEFEKRDSLNIKFHFQKDRVYLKDVNDKLKVAGDIDWRKPNSSIVLRDKVFDKFDIPTDSPRIPFEDIKELKTLFYHERGNWLLREFPLNSEYTHIYRVNFKGRLVICGELKNGIMNLHHSLMNKYKIKVFTYTKEESDNSRFIHFDEDKKLWLLNDFERLERKDTNTKEDKV